jgi:hypothetical protein
MLLRSLLTIFFCSGLLCAQQEASDHGRVHAEMRNVVYHYTDSIAVHIIHLEGELLPVGEAGLPVFDDPNSFIVEIHSAEMSITTAALESVLSQYAFRAPDAPIKAIRVSTRGGKLTVRGRLLKGDLPFESEGSLAATPDGEIRIHTEKIKAMHVPVKGLMDLVGENLARLVNMKKVRGIRAEGDDLILSPAELFPAPHIRGRLTSIAIRGSEIVQKYGGAPQSSIKVTGNYMAYRGARLRFGKLTMTDTDLTLIDMDPQDPLDFFLDHYWDQLAAGYSKITHNFGLRTYCRDYQKLTTAQKTARKVTR